MVCINCSHAKTAVINSRPAKKSYEVWRRRQCPKCHYAVTTREKIDLADVISVENDKRSSPYDPARLTISILRVSDSTGLDASDAYWLSETIGKKLVERHKSNRLPVKLTTKQIREVTYETLTHYHPVAGLTYGAAHGMVVPTSKRRRGRPSLSQ